MDWDCIRLTVWHWSSQVKVYVGDDLYNKALSFAVKVTVFPTTTLQMVLSPACLVRKPWTTSQSLVKLAVSLVGQKTTTHPVKKVIQNALHGATIILHTFTWDSLTHSRIFLQRVTFAVVISNVWGTATSWLPRICSHELLYLLEKSWLM